MSPNVYLCIVSLIRIAYFLVRIAIRIVSFFFRIDPALIFCLYSFNEHCYDENNKIKVVEISVIIMLSCIRGTNKCLNVDTASNT